MTKVQIVVTLDDTGKPIKMEATLLGVHGPGCMKHAENLKGLAELHRTKDYDSGKPKQTITLRG